MSGRAAAAEQRTYSEQLAVMYACNSEIIAFQLQHLPSLPKKFDEDVVPAAAAPDA